jgi:hypothetical protein
MCFHLVAVCSRCGVVTNPGYHLVRPCEMRACEFGTRDLMAYDDLGEHQLDVCFCQEANFFYLLSVFEPTPPCRNQQCAVLTQEQIQEQIREQMQHNSILTIPEVLAWLGPILSPQDSQLLIDSAWNVVWQNRGPWFAQHDMAGNNVPTQGVQLGPLGPDPQPNLPLLVGSTPAVGQPAPHLPHLAGNQVGPSTQRQARPRRWTPEEDRRLLDLNRQGLSDKEILVSKVPTTRRLSLTPMGYILGWTPF